MTSIIIPVVDNEDYTEQCISSLKKNTKDYELIVVDNGSIRNFVPDDDWIDVTSFGDENTPYVGKKEGIGNLLVIRNEENLGYPKAINQGIIFAKGEYICILNNDTVLTKDWLDHLVYHLENGLDAVGPMTNNISGIQKTNIDIYDTEETLNEAAIKFYEKNKGKYTLCWRLVGFCLAFKKEVIDKIGLFDQNFGLGDYEDEDFCLRAIEAGFRLGISNDCYIHHFGSATHKSLKINYEELLKINKKYFDSKWSEDVIKQIVERNK